MSWIPYTHTTLQCSNSELIAPCSTFALHCRSFLFNVEDEKSYFTTSWGTMDGEIIKLSLEYPDETFSGEFFLEDNWDIVLTSFVCQNGILKDVGIRSEYYFEISHDCQIPDEQQYTEFRKHVLEYVKRLDIARENEDGFYMDVLHDKKNRNGYKSHITITWENNSYVWTALRYGYSLIIVDVQEKEPKIKQKKQLEKTIASEGIENVITKN